MPTTPNMTATITPVIPMNKPTIWWNWRLDSSRSLLRRAVASARSDSRRAAASLRSLSRRAVASARSDSRKAVASARSDSRSRNKLVESMGLDSSLPMSVLRLPMSALVASAFWVVFSVCGAGLSAWREVGGQRRGRQARHQILSERLVGLLTEPSVEARAIFFGHSRHLSRWVWDGHEPYAASRAAAK